MRFRVSLLLAAAAIQAVTAAEGTEVQLKGSNGRLLKRTGEDDNHKNYSSVAAEFSISSNPFFLKDETSSYAKDQPITSSFINRDDKSTSTSAYHQSPSLIPSKDDKLSRVLAKDQSTINPYTIKDDGDKGSLSTSVPSKDDKTTPAIYKHESPTSVEAKNDKSTSINEEAAFYEYLATKDKDKKPTSAIVQTTSSTSSEIGNDKSTNVPSKDKDLSPAVIVYSITLPVASSTPKANFSSRSLVAPSNLLISEVTFPGYKIVPSPTGGLLKDHKSDTSTSIIPVWTPALLGNAYGGGVIPTPSIYVVRQSLPNGPPTGVPPGYGGSSPQTQSGVSSVIPFVSNTSSVEIKNSIYIATAHQELGTGSVKYEATSPFLHFVTKTILTTTTYCPVTTISGKSYTFSSTTLTKTFATAIVIAVAGGTPTDLEATQSLSYTVASGHATGRSNVPTIIENISIKTPKTSSKTSFSGGKLPPVPSKEAGLSQGHFTNTSTEISLTKYQSVPGEESLSKKESATATTGVQSLINSPTSSISSVASGGLGSSPQKSESQRVKTELGVSKIPTRSTNVLSKTNDVKYPYFKSEHLQTSNVAVPGSHATESLKREGKPASSAIALSPISESPSRLVSSGVHAATIPALPSSLISELISVLGSPVESKSTVSPVPASLISELLSAFGSREAITSTIPAPQGSLAPTLPSLFRANESKVEIKPNVPASLVSELSSLLNIPKAETVTVHGPGNSPGLASPSLTGASGSEIEIKPNESLVSQLLSLLKTPGAQTQSSAIASTPLGSKVAPTIIGPGDSNFEATTPPTPAAESGTFTSGSGLAVANVSSGPLVVSSTNGDKIIAGSALGAVPSKSGAAGISPITAGFGTLSTSESSVAIFAGPSAGTEMSVGRSGPSFIGLPQQSTALSVETKAGSSVASGAVAPNSAAASPAPSSSTVTSAIQLGGPISGVTSPESSGGVSSIPGLAGSIIVNASTAGSLHSQGASAIATTSLSAISASRNSASGSSAEASKSNGHSESTFRDFGNVKPESSQEGLGFTVTPILSTITTEGSQQASPNGVLSFASAAAASASKAAVPFTATIQKFPGITALPTQPEVATESSPQTLVPPDTSLQHSSGSLEAAGNSGLPTNIAPGSSPKQSSAGVSGLAVGNSYTGLQENSSVPPKVATIQNLPAEVQSASSPKQSSSALLVISGSSTPAGPLPTSSFGKPAGSLEVSVTIAPSNLQIPTSLGPSMQELSTVLGLASAASPSASLSATTLQSTSLQIPSEARQAAEASSPNLQSPTSVLSAAATTLLEEFNTPSSVSPTPTVSIHGGSPGGPVIPTGTQATFSTGVNSKSSSRGNDTVSVILNPTAVSPFLGAAVKMPSPFGLCLTALLSIFLL